MRKFNLFSPPRRESARTAANAVVVCVGRARDRSDDVADEEVQTLAAQLCCLAQQQRLGDYEGCDISSSESRLYFTSTRADRLAAAAMRLGATLTWRDQVTIKVSREPRRHGARPRGP
jgi:hypothetical protein